MRKISDIRGEDALDVLADIMEPASEIMADEEIASMYRSGNRIKAISTAIKNHKKSVIHVLAILDGEDPDGYSPSLISLPTKIIEILNDPELDMVFTSQGQMQGENASGSAMENTEEIVEE